VTPAGAARRALAEFLGAFALASAVAPLVAGHPTSRLWWVDLSPLPPAVALSVVALAAVGLLVRARTPRGEAAPSPRMRVAVYLACVVLLPLALEVFDGRVDERGPADAAVVFGARVYADGRCSPALADRVRTAVRLHRAGLVHTLVFSGGPGDGAIAEPDAMRALAIKMGVPASAIRLDPGGVSTRATVVNTAPLLAPMGRVLAVSHAYHLPRVRSSYAARGLAVRCVPAEESYTLTQMPWLMAREILSLWAHWGRTLAGFGP
jgi:SanA protein